jgi:CHAT domain-containing protein
MYGKKFMSKIKILFVSANPTGTTPLKLDEEVREIEAKIRAAEHRDSVELITKWAARPDDLLQSLNQHKPHVVHFSGHGSSTEEIILLDKQGKPKPVSKEALVSLFSTLKDNVRLVLLNACFSRPQAEAITGEVDCAIGMSRAIGDDAAITFAASFYRAIGFGRSVKDAFDQGKTSLLLEGIPEERTPDLMTRQTVRPELVVLVNPQ